MRIGIISFSLYLIFTLLLAEILTPHTSAQTSGRPLEEVQVTAFSGCGPWPINHRFISTCSYAQLKGEKLDAVRAMRAQTFNNCLSCDSGVCRPKQNPLNSASDSKLCRKLFWTPTRVGVIRGSLVSARDLIVDFTYAISRQGRVTDIGITYLESELTHQKVLAMIRDGAAQIDFEPVELDGVAVEIVDLEHGFTLERR